MASEREIGIERQGQRREASFIFMNIATLYEGPETTSAIKTVKRVQWKGENCAGVSRIRQTDGETKIQIQIRTRTKIQIQMHIHGLVSGFQFHL